MGNVHVQQNKLQVGIKEAKWVGEWVWGEGSVGVGGQFDEHHLSGPVRLCRMPVIN